MIGLNVKIPSSLKMSKIDHSISMKAIRLRFSPIQDRSIFKIYFLLKKSVFALSSDRND